MHKTRYLRYNAGMMLHNPISGETTPLPAQGRFDYSGQSATEPARISLQRRPFGHVLQVLSGRITVNNHPIRESALLYPGDELVVGETRLVFISDENLPPQCHDAHRLADLSNSHQASTDPSDSSGEDALANNTTGIRWLSGPDSGHFQPIEQETLPCGAIRLHPHQDTLVLAPQPMNTAKKQPLTLVNGYAVFKANASPVLLRHGDVVQAGDCRFRAEIPSSAGESSFSPSHPHNIQLSEEYRDDSVPTPAPATGTNRWLWVLGGGLLALMTLTWWLKTHT